MRPVIVAAVIMLTAAADLLGQRQQFVIPPNTALLVFGGRSNSVYLGCLNCSEIDPESVRNDIGKYGSSISPTSIRNRISLYGSRIAPTSACNEIAGSPPVVVDDDGNFYGELTVNNVRPRRIRDRSILAWLAAMCAAD